MLKVIFFGNVCKCRVFIYRKSYVKNHATFVIIFTPKLSRFYFLCERSEQHWNSKLTIFANLEFIFSGKKNREKSCHHGNNFRAKIIYFYFIFYLASEAINIWIPFKLNAKSIAFANLEFLFTAKIWIKITQPLFCFVEVALPQKWTNPNTWPSIIHWNYPTAENF